MSNEAENTEIAVKESAKIRTLHTDQIQGVSPLVHMFASGQVPLDQMGKMMDLQERYEANEAKKAFHEALAMAKAEMPVARKSGKNTHLNSTYATLDDYLAVANPVLAKFGLSVSWDVGDQTAEAVTATCRISHQRGHSEASAPVTMPITKGNNAVSPAQSVGIAMTYARRYSFTAILGMATEDGDGGNAPKETPAKKQLPPYKAADFKKNYPIWKKRVEDGINTPADIINSLQLKSTLTTDMLRDLDGLKDCVPVTK